MPYSPHPILPTLTDRPGRCHRADLSDAARPMGTVFMSREHALAICPNHIFHLLERGSGRSRHQVLAPHAHARIDPGDAAVLGPHLPQRPYLSRRMKQKKFRTICRCLWQSGCEKSWHFLVRARSLLQMRIHSSKKLRVHLGRFSASDHLWQMPRAAPSS